MCPVEEETLTVDVSYEIQEQYNLGRASYLLDHDDACVAYFHWLVDLHHSRIVTTFRLVSQATPYSELAT